MTGPLTLAAADGTLTCSVTSGRIGPPALPGQAGPLHLEGTIDSGIDEFTGAQGTFVLDGTLVLAGPINGTLTGGFTLPS